MPTRTCPHRLYQENRIQQADALMAFEVGHLGPDLVAASADTTCTHDSSRQDTVFDVDLDFLVGEPLLVGDDSDAASG